MAVVEPLKILSRLPCYSASYSAGREQRRSYFYNWAFRNEEGHLEELNEKGLEFGLQTDVPNNEMCQRQMPRKEFNQDGLPMDEKHKQALLTI